MTAPILQFDDVSLRFGDHVALDRVSFQMGPGESRVVLGAAGSGKTVLLKVAVGLQKPDSGKVLLFGQDITSMTEHKLFDLRARVGILFQEGALFDSLTIADNVSYPLQNQRVLKPAQDAERTTEERVRETLRFVELEQTMQQFPSELSGGMRRRVGIARAVVTQPELVLYDSPTAGLDPITAHTIITLILKERDTRNTAAIVVTHRYQDGQMMANFRYNPNSGAIERAPRGSEETVDTKFLIMQEGRMVFEGSEGEFLANSDPYVKKFTRPGAS
ncbi:MAG: ATP-binding cassette domain-containing protein [Acidobacteriota bacterium]